MRPMSCHRICSLMAPRLSAVLTAATAPRAARSVAAAGHVRRSGGPPHGASTVRPSLVRCEPSNRWAARAGPRLEQGPRDRAAHRAIRLWPLTEIDLPIRHASSTLFGPMDVLPTFLVCMAQPHPCHTSVAAEPRTAVQHPTTSSLIVSDRIRLLCFSWATASRPPIARQRSVSLSRWLIR